MANVKSPGNIVVIGGGIIGSCTALFLAHAGAEQVTVVERDLTYRDASTTRSAAAIRQQFHLGINVAMSHFGYGFYTNLDSYLPEGEDADIDFVERGYLVLATPEATERLGMAHQRQLENGAQVELLEGDALIRKFPWLKVDDIGAATFGTAGEGWFDPTKALDTVRRAASGAGVSYLQDEVVDIGVGDGTVTTVELAAGGSVSCSLVVNAAGPGAGRVAGMVGERVPVEGRKRTVFLFRPRTPVEGVTNVVDPTVAGRGMYLRPYEELFMVVTAPPPEKDPDTTDLQPDGYLFDEVLRPALARRVHGFEEVDLVRAWAGHYELNTFDQNAIIGRHPSVEGFYFACGLSGHGVMHAPAVGRGIAELITEGGYRTLDLSMFTPSRIERGERLDDIQPSETRRQKAGI